MRRAQREQVGSRARSRSGKEKEDEVEGRLGQAVPRSVAFRDPIKCDGDKKMTELDRVKLDLVPAWVRSLHRFTSTVEESLLYSSKR